MPAVLAADRVGLNRKREVLVDAGLLPPDALGVRVVARERTRPLDLAHSPLPGLGPREIDDRGGPPPAARALVKSPATAAMRARDHPGPDCLRHPHLVGDAPEPAGSLD